MKVALVLGSGGARGYAHIGVIDELKARGHEIVGVSGCSMGALVGGVYAAGALPEVATYARTLSSADVRRLADFAIGAPGLVRLRKVVDKLHDFIGDVRIEDLDIPFTAVATDFDQQHEVWFRSGPLLAALRASISIPGIFTPVRIDDRLLVDGGLLNPLPVGPCMDYPADITVGVSLFGRDPGLRSTPSRESSDGAEADDSDDDGSASFTDIVEGRLADTSAGRWLQSKLSPPNVADGLYDEPSDVTLIDMSTRALDMMQARIEIGRTATNAPDVLVSVPMSTCTALDFQLADKVITLGRKLAVQEFDRAGI